MDMQMMMKQAQAMQQKMEEAQKKIAEIEVTGSSGGGMVSLTVNGKGEARKVKIDPSIIDPNDIEMLEDLIVAAINDTKNKTEEIVGKEMSSVTGGLNLPAGMKLPF